MPQFAIVRLPFLTEAGEPLSLAPNQWQLRSDLRAGSIRIQGNGHTRTLDLREVLAVEVGEEKEVTAVGATLGRMALTGIGAALVSRGRRGGFGASLLDLSVRGAVKQSAATGVMVWPDTTILSFGVQGAEVEQFLNSVPAEAFEEEALEEAQHRLGLLERMRADGRRALDEMAQEVAQVALHVRELNARAEQGATFTERDEARQEAMELQWRLTTMRGLCTALQADLGVSTRDLVTAAPDYPAALPAPNSIASPQQEATAPAQATSAPHADNAGANGWTREQWTGVGIFLFGIWAVLHFVLKVI